MPRVSIVQATYGHGKFISNSIRSVLNQSFGDWELLTGDDASLDDTYSVATSAANGDPRIRIWRHEKNLGLVENIQFLLEKISEDSEFVAFLEGDDEFDPENLAKKISLFESDPELGVVISSHSNIDASGRAVPNNGFIEAVLTHKPKLKSGGPHRASAAELLEMLGNPIKSFGSAMIRKSLLEKIGSLESPNGDSMFGPFDYYLWLQLLPRTSFWNLDAPLLRYRVHANNFSDRKNARKFIRQTLSGLDTLKEMGTFASADDDSAYEFAKEYFLALLEFLDGRRLEALKHWTATFRFRKISQWFVRLKLLLRIVSPCSI